MKATFAALAALAVGVVIGNYLTQRELRYDAMPIEITPAGGASSGAGAVKKGPRAVVINSERHEFGTMDRSEHRVHDFVIRNEGDAPLTLSAGEPSCGVCVKVFRVDREKLQPGENANVRFEWEPKPSETEFEQSGPITTNDPYRPSITLTVHGTVIDTVRAERSDVHFHDISANQPAANAINIYAFKSADLQIEKVEQSSASQEKFIGVSFAPLTSEELAKEANAKGGLKMTIDVKPGLPMGSFNQTITVTTNQNAKVPLTVNVIGNVASDILLAGPRVDASNMLVSLGTIARGTAAKHTMYLRVKGPYREQTEVKLVSIEPAGRFNVTIGEASRDNPKIVLFPLTIEVPATAAPANHSTEGAYAKIHLATTHPDVKELTINVRYLVKE